MVVSRSDEISQNTRGKAIGKMKRRMTAVAGLVLGACVTAPAGHRTEVTVTPGTEAHHYVVQFRIMDAARDGKTVVLSAPGLVVKAGEAGKVTVGDEKEQNGVLCTALVKEKGTEKLSTAQSITVKR
jgi:hypothetical protein